ncbi:MAG: hypothetical protein SAL07_19645 [Oscillatoria sp. PMC 1051.18]|nr:hypothetical protein [Oscillatoria sp. PMC 1050.18]MEC5032117.1 hypothetical protein [Oscillatoria sp. PMC 1051.18]
MLKDLTNDTYLINEEALSELGKYHELLQKIYFLFSSVFLWGAAMGFPSVLVSWAALIPMSVILNRIRKVNLVMRATEALLEEFASDVIVVPRIPVPGMRPIDLFVRFPGRALFLISIRSKGKTKIVFSEKHSLLCARLTRKNGGLSKWKPDPLAELSSYQRWLKKNRRELGLSSKESSRPTAKVLALSGETEIESHKEHFYSETGNEKFLWIKTKGTAALIRKEEIVKFVKAYLIQGEQKKLQQANLN